MPKANNNKTNDDGNDNDVELNVSMVNENKSTQKNTSANFVIEMCVFIFIYIHGFGSAFTFRLYSKRLQVNTFGFFTRHIFFFVVDVWNVKWKKKNEEKVYVKNVLFSVMRQ